MSLLEAFVLAIVQGATEFLPVSSSAHLILVPWWLGWEQAPLTYDVTVHLGTTLAVLGYFWHDWQRLAQAALRIVGQRKVNGPDEWLVVWLIVSTIPAVIAGLLLEDYFESVLSDPPLVAAMLLVTASLLVLSEQLSQQARSKSSDDLTFGDAVLIGLAQACAILPGVSRSGSTMSAGLLRGLTREAAARYSFLMSTPIILGAGLKQGLDILTGAEQGGDAGVLVVGFVVSALTGYACIAFLLGYVRRRSFYPFAAYCVAFSLITLAAIALRG
jgi:undecaprenyl-diphosphatase